MLKKIQPKLSLCLLLDLVGIISYAFPFLGELIDIVWSPLSATIYYYMFGYGIGTIVQFIEEALPFTDIIPTFTISYFIWKGIFKQNRINKK